MRRFDAYVIGFPWALMAGIVVAVRNVYLVNNCRRDKETGQVILGDRRPAISDSMQRIFRNSS